MRAITLTLFPILTAAAMPAAADQNGGWQGMHDHMMWGNGYGVLGGLMMIVFWGAIIALIFFAVKSLMDRQSGQPKRDALDSLRERFAAGEIDEEEFERRKTALER